ncbi:hypothetical protein [Pyxidicoccus caerfyrddinensis]|nr:hypothetical protein [Pyxidicoccus caerfyrddinensis]
MSGANRERAEIVVTRCLPSASTSSSTGLYFNFTGGNFLCFQATR